MWKTGVEAIFNIITYYYQPYEDVIPSLIVGEGRGPFVVGCLVDTSGPVPALEHTVCWSLVKQASNIGHIK